MSDGTLDDSFHEDRLLVDALRRRDEKAFVRLVDTLHSSFVRTAMTFVRDRAIAEEVAQDTWLALLRGLDSFEGRSSLKTWAYRILVNRAISRAAREGRTVNFSALGENEIARVEPAVEPDRFLPMDHPRGPGHWATRPEPWNTPEDVLLSSEILGLLEEAIDALPPVQKEVIRLRDVEGFEGQEICEILGLSEGNMRVLLHRARSKVRASLDHHLQRRPQ